MKETDNHALAQRFMLLPPDCGNNFTFSYGESIYHGLFKQPANKPWITDPEDILPNKINAFSHRRGVAVMGTG